MHHDTPCKPDRLHKGHIVLQRPDLVLDAHHAQTEPELVQDVLRAQVEPELCSTKARPWSWWSPWSEKARSCAWCSPCKCKARAPPRSSYGSAEARSWRSATPLPPRNARSWRSTAPHPPRSAQGQLRHIHHAVPDCQVDSHDDAQRHPDRWVWINPYSQNQYSSIQTVARLEERLLYPELLNFTFQPHLFRLTCSKRTIFLPQKFPGYISILHLQLWVACTYHRYPKHHWFHSQTWIAEVPHSLATPPEKVAPVVVVVPLASPAEDLWHLCPVWGVPQTISLCFLPLRTILL